LLYILDGVVGVRTVTVPCTEEVKCVINVKNQEVISMVNILKLFNKTQCKMLLKRIERYQRHIHSLRYWIQQDMEQLNKHLAKMDLEDKMNFYIDTGYWCKEMEMKQK
jgi:ABC-type enterochelin transport system ATPase subunit